MIPSCETWWYTILCLNLCYCRVYTSVMHSYGVCFGQRLQKILINHVSEHLHYLTSCPVLHTHSVEQPQPKRNRWKFQVATVIVKHGCRPFIPILWVTLPGLNNEEWQLYWTAVCTWPRTTLKQKTVWWFSAKRSYLSRGKQLPWEVRMIQQGGKRVWTPPLFKNVRKGGVTALAGLKVISLSLADTRDDDWPGKCQCPVDQGPVHTIPDKSSVHCNHFQLHGLSNP